MNTVYVVKWWFVWSDELRSSAGGRLSRWRRRRRPSPIATYQLSGWKIGSWRYSSNEKSAGAPLLDGDMMHDSTFRAPVLPIFLSFYFESFLKHSWRRWSWEWPRSVLYDTLMFYNCVHFVCWWWMVTTQILILIPSLCCVQNVRFRVGTYSVWPQVRDRRDTETF